MVHFGGVLMLRAEQILKQYYGYDSFRQGQEEIINAFLSGRDVLGIMPTGAGKSLCYQIPALMMPGITIVISPLISLMRDQVQALSANGIPAAYINSSLSPGQIAATMSKAKAGIYKLIYVAPERLMSPSIVAFSQNADLTLLAVDEAHCISQWGQDFRPSYLDIPGFVSQLPKRPLLAAFTATATPKVRDDILRILGLQQPFLLTTGFDRPNLYFEVRTPSDKYAVLKKYLSKNEGCGIVYCSTRKEVENVTERLLKDDYLAARYHAGLSDQERSTAQDNFLYDRIRIIVATNAFGMGIDKSNVRFVVHYNMPQTLESYYQEAGRAGRDGLPSDCILLYARKDINTALFLINKSENQDEIRRNKRLLNHIERYCETDSCLREYILKYFGEQAPHNCDNCSNCTSDLQEKDISIDAQKLLSCIARLNKQGRSLMFAHTAAILQGNSDDFKDLSTFGIMKGSSVQYIRILCNKLKALGYIIDDEYLRITNKAWDVMTGKAKVFMRPLKLEKDAAKERRKTKAPVLSNAEQDLLNKLKEVRLKIAQTEGVPAFVIFSDATLVDMCQKLPQTKKELLQVSGIGKIKLEHYGEEFSHILRYYAPSVIESQNRLLAALAEKMGSRK